MCVAYAWEAWLRSHPVVNAHRPELAVNIPGLYREAQSIDEWPGEDYDGTSVRAGAKALQRQGFITGYSWAYDVGTIFSHIIEKGPMVVGTVWTEDMFAADRHGYIWPTGNEVGGHAYLLIGANLERENPDGSTGAFRIVNSWGENWEDGGRAWITSGSMQILMEHFGEACTATEVQVR
jgi:C1A family cysteine protease